MEIIFFVFGFIIVYLFSKESSKAFYYIAFLLLLSLYIFKDNTTFPDLEVYEDYYTHIGEKLDFDYRVGLLKMEEGWYILNYILRKISPSFMFLILLYGIVYSGSAIISIRRYSVMPFISFLLFFFFAPNSLFILRQYLGIAVCLLSIPYIIERKLVPFMVLSLVAFSFHNALLAWLPLYWLYGINYNKKTIVLLCVGCFFLISAINVVLNSFIPFFSKLESYISGDIETHNSWKAFAFSLFYFIFVILVYRLNKVELIGSTKLFLLMQSIAFFFSMVEMVGTSFSALYRIIPIFSVSTVFTLPNACNNINNTFLRFAFMTLFVLLFVYGFISTINAQGIYRFIF